MLANWRRGDKKMPQRRYARDQKRGTRYDAEEKPQQIQLDPQFQFLPSQLCQTLGDNLFFICHIVLGVGKPQQMANKKYQTIKDALISYFFNIYICVVRFNMTYNLKAQWYMATSVCALVPAVFFSLFSRDSFCATFSKLIFKCFFCTTFCKLILK